MSESKKKEFSVGSVWRSTENGKNVDVEFLIVSRIYTTPLNETTLSDSLWVAVAMWNPIKTCNTHIFDDYGSEVNMYRNQDTRLTSRRRKTPEGWRVDLDSFTQHNMGGQEYDVLGV